MDEDAGKQHSTEAAAATEAAEAAADVRTEPAAAERDGRQRAAGERGGRRVQWPPDAQLRTITEYQVPQQRGVISPSGKRQVVEVEVEEVVEGSARRRIFTRRWWRRIRKRPA